MNTFKDAFKFLSVAVLGFCLAACGGDEPDNPNNPDEPDTPKTVKSVSVMYIFQTSEDMLSVADVESAWTNPDGTKDRAKVTKTQHQLVSTYSTFPATASLSMTLIPKSPAPDDDEKFILSASCDWYAYEVTYTDGTKYTVSNSAPTTSGLPTLGKDVPKYLERLNTRLSDISCSIVLSDSESGITISLLNK